MPPKVLLILHAVSAGVLVGSTTHLALQSIALLRNRANPRLLRLYPKVALVAWAITALLGAVSYPRYRVMVRAAFLDANAPGASRMFDAKEALILFVAPMLAAVLSLHGRAVHDRDPASRRWLAVCAVSASAAIWYAAITGLYVTSLRSV